MGSREGSKWELVSLLLLLGAWRLSTIRVEDVIIGANVTMKQILYTIYYIIYTILVVYMQHIKCEHMIIETWMPPGTWRKHKTPSAMPHDRSLPVENPTGIFCWNSTVIQAQKKVLRKWRPNLESEIRCEDRPARRKPTPVNGIPWVLLNFPASSVKPKNVWNLNMVSLCHGMKEIKSILYNIFFYNHVNINKQPTLARSSKKNMLPRCGCAITGTISSLKLPGPLVIEIGELKKHPSWLDPYVNIGYIHRWS